MGTFLALDPSSTCTGWAIFSHSNDFGKWQLIQLGRLAPPAHRPAWDRIKAQADELTTILTRHCPDLAVIEVASNLVHSAARARKQSRFSLGGLMTLAHGQGVLIGTIQGGHLPWIPIKETEWTAGIPKTARATRTAKLVPQYAAWLKTNNDPGLDVADAVGLGDWFAQTQRIKHLTAEHQCKPQPQPKRRPRKKSE